MGIIRRLFGRSGKEDDSAVMLPAIERAVLAVEPLLKQAGGYPQRYFKPVAAALDYAHRLASEIPGPVAVDRVSYAGDAFVHALFPDVDAVSESLCTSVAVQDYLRDFPASEEFYALMGMRRFEKTVVGMEVVGQVVQHDVVQKAVYFTSHTIDNPASSEQHAREQIAMSFFDSLARKIRKRVEERKQVMHDLVLEKDMLLARMRVASAQDKPALEQELTKLLEKLQATVTSLEPGNYIDDFEAVMLRPQDHLYLKQDRITLDSMGIRRPEDAGAGEAITFNQLIGYDRRDWTVTLVHCGRLQHESFADKLDKAYRRLAI